MITISYNYSSNDIEFLEASIKQAKMVTDDIHFTYVNKFFDGSDENIDLINESKKIGHDVNFHELDFLDLTTQIPDKQTRFKYWHNASRVSNANHSKYNYVLFLDGDEILDGLEFKNWLSQSFERCNSYVFNVYWYFRNKKYQATTWEEGPVMVNKNSLSQNDLMNTRERWALLKNPCNRNTLSLNKKPMIHHYSWAKGNSEKECEEKLLKKIKSWGHSTDRDWENQIKEEFLKPFSGTDFIHNYKYKIL
jgi:hypothetical protein